MKQPTNMRLSEAAEAFKLDELERRLEFDDSAPTDGGGGEETDIYIILWSKPW